MKEDYLLDNKFIEVYLTSGYSFQGLVVLNNSEKIVLQADEEDYIVIFKKHLTAAKILNENINQRQEKNNRDIELLWENTSFEEFSNNYGSIIPGDMLEEPEEDEFPTDFSISMAGLKNIKEDKVDNANDNGKEEEDNNK